MFLEPSPFVENGQGYYQKSNSASPTETSNDAHLISTQQEPPATPTPSSMDHPHHPVKYETPSRRPSFQPVTTLKIPIPRRAEASSPDMARPPHPSAVPASVHAQAALRRPAPAVAIIPKPSPAQQQPAKKGFHVVKYEVKQERYYVHPSLKGQKLSPPSHQQHHPPPPSYNMPPSDHSHNTPSSGSEGGHSSEGDESHSDGSSSEGEGEDDGSEPESSSEEEEEEEEPLPKPKPGKRKRTAMGPIKFKDEAGSSFIDKNAHIKRPRNAWIHVRPIQPASQPASGLIDQQCVLDILSYTSPLVQFRCHYGQALKAQDPTLRTDEISKYDNCIIDQIPNSIRSTFITLSSFHSMSSRSLSRRASRRWAKLTDKQKKPWHDLAEQEKQAHKEAFPEYRYCPKRNAKKERQKYKRKNQLGTIMK